VIQNMQNNGPRILPAGKMYVNAQVRHRAPSSRYPAFMFDLPTLYCKPDRQERFIVMNKNSIFVIFCGLFRISHSFRIRNV